MKLLLLLVTLLTLGCSIVRPYHISARPSYESLVQAKRKNSEQVKVILDIDQKTKNLHIKKKASSTAGSGVETDFNIGEAFSGRLTEIFKNIFVKEALSPPTLKIDITDCYIAFGNSSISPILN